MKEENFNLYKVWIQSEYFSEELRLWHVYKEDNFLKWIDLTENKTYDETFISIEDAENHLNQLQFFGEINRWSKYYN